MCSLRDVAKDLSDLGAVTYGLSLDDVADLGKFARDQKLEFQLLSDPDGSVAAKFGVLGKRGFANRVTFVIDPGGMVAHVDTSVDVSKHGGDLVGVLRELSGQ